MTGQDSPRNEKGVPVPTGWNMTETLPPLCQECPQSSLGCGFVLSRDFRACEYSYDEGTGLWSPTSEFPYVMRNFGVLGPYNPYLRHQKLMEMQRLLSTLNFVAIGQPAGAYGSRNQGDGVVNWSEYATLMVVGEETQWSEGNADGYAIIVEYDGPTSDPHRIGILGAFTPAYLTDSGNPEWSGGATSPQPGDMISYTETGRSALLYKVESISSSRMKLMYLNRLGIEGTERNVVWNRETVREKWHSILEPKFLWTVRKEIRIEKDEIPSASTWITIHEGKMADAVPWKWHNGVTNGVLTSTAIFAGTLLVFHVQTDGSLTNVTPDIIAANNWRNYAVTRGSYEAQIRLPVEADTDYFIIHFCPSTDKEDDSDGPVFAPCQDRCKHSIRDYSNSWSTATHFDRAGLASATAEGLAETWYCDKMWQKSGDNYTALVEKYSPDCQQTNCPHYAQREPSGLSESIINTILFARNIYERQVEAGWNVYRIGRVSAPSITFLAGAPCPQWNRDGTYLRGLYLPRVYWLGNKFGRLIDKPDKAENEGDVKIVGGAVLEADGNGSLGSFTKKNMLGETDTHTYEKQFPVRRASAISTVDGNPPTAEPVRPSSNFFQSRHTWQVVWPNVSLSTSTVLTESQWSNRLLATEIDGEEYALQLVFDGSMRDYDASAYIESRKIVSANIEGDYLVLSFLPAISTFYAVPDPYVPQMVRTIYAATAGKTVAPDETYLVQNPGCRGNLSMWGSRYRSLHAGNTISLSGSGIPSNIEGKLFWITEASAFSGDEYTGEDISRTVSMEFVSFTGGACQFRAFTYLTEQVFPNSTHIHVQYVGPNYFPSSGYVLIEGEAIRYSSINTDNHTLTIAERAEAHEATYEVGAEVTMSNPATADLFLVVYAHNPEAHTYGASDVLNVQYQNLRYEPDEVPGVYESIYKAYKRDLAGYGSVVGLVLPHREEMLVLKANIRALGKTGNGTQNDADNIDLRMSIGYYADGNTSEMLFMSNFLYPVLYMDGETPVFGCPSVPFQDIDDFSEDFSVYVFDDYRNSYIDTEFTQETVYSSATGYSGTPDEDGVLRYEFCEFEVPRSERFHIFSKAGRYFLALPIELWNRSVKIVYTPQVAEVVVDPLTEPDGPGIPQKLLDDRLKMDTAKVSLLNAEGKILKEWINGGGNLAGLDIVPSHKGTFPHDASAELEIRAHPNGESFSPVEAIVGTNSLYVKKSSLDAVAGTAQNACFRRIGEVYSRTPMITNQEVDWLSSALESALQWIDTVDAVSFGEDTKSLGGSVSGEYTGTPMSLHVIDYGESPPAIYDGRIIELSAYGGGWRYAWGHTTPVGTGRNEGDANIQYAPLSEIEVGYDLGVNLREILVKGILRRIPSSWVLEAKIDILIPSILYTELRWGVDDGVIWEEWETVDSGGEVSFGAYTVQENEGSWSISRAAHSLPGNVESGKWTTIDITSLVKFMMNNSNEQIYLAPTCSNDITDLDGTLWLSHMKGVYSPHTVSYSGDPHNMTTISAKGARMSNDFQMRGTKIRLDLDAIKRDMPHIVFNADGPANFPPLKGDDE